MDAPLHFVRNGQTIDEIPISDLMGPGIVIDVRKKSKNGYEDYHVSVDDFKEWEKQNGRIPHRAVVFILTGKANFYSNATKYYGWRTEEHARNKDVNELHNPGMSEEAAKWLTRERGIVGTGIDAMNMDPGDLDDDFRAHRVLLPQKVWILENVNEKLAQLPPRGFYVLAMPYKLKGGSGAPTRLVAVLGYDPESAAFGGAPIVKTSFVSIVLALIMSKLF